MTLRCFSRHLFCWIHSGLLSCSTCVRNRSNLNLTTHKRRAPSRKTAVHYFHSRGDWLSELYLALNLHTVTWASSILCLTYTADQPICLVGWKDGLGCLHRDPIEGGHNALWAMWAAAFTWGRPGGMGRERRKREQWREQNIKKAKTPEKCGA